MKLIVTKGATSQSVYLFILDSSVTTGAGLTGLAYNTGSLTAYYVRGGTGSATAITLATLANAQASFSSGGFVVVDGTNMPGVYRLDIPDAVLASGANWAVIMLKGATNMVPCVLEIELIAADLQDSVRAGLTALPNVASGSAGAIITSGTGTAQLSVSSGAVTAGTVSDKTGYSLTATTGLGNQTANITGNITGNVSGSVGSVTAGVTLDSAAVDAIHDDVVENSKTFRQMFRLMYSALVGKVSGLGTTTVSFRDDADSKDRIVATVDGDGNRTAFSTRDGT